MVDFPNNPVDGDEHTEENVTWVYNDPPAVWSVKVVDITAGTQGPLVITGADATGSLIQLENQQHGSRWNINYWNGGDLAINHVGGSNIFQFPPDGAATGANDVVRKSDLSAAGGFTWQRVGLNGLSQHTFTVPSTARLFKIGLLSVTYGTANDQDLLIQLGNPGIITSGYQGSTLVHSTNGAGKTYTNGFACRIANNGRLMSGTAEIMSQDGADWSFSGTGGFDSSLSWHGGGRILDKSGVTAIKFLMSGGSAFDGGQIHLGYQ